MKTAEEKRAYMRAWRAKNKDKVKASNQRHGPGRAADMSPRQWLDYRRKANRYYARNKERICEYQREWQKNRKEKLIGILENVTKEKVT
jgi:hypothetical protein